MSAQFPFKPRTTKGEVTLLLDSKEVNIPWVQPSTMVHLVFNDERTAIAYRDKLLLEAKYHAALSGIEKSKPIKNYQYEKQSKCALPITYKQLQTLSKLHINKNNTSSQETAASTNDENTSPPGGLRFK